MILEVRSMSTLYRAVRARGIRAGLVQSKPFLNNEFWAAPHHWAILFFSRGSELGPLRIPVC